MALVAIIVIVLLVLLPAVALIWRFKKDDETVGGGSFGHQIGDGDEDWGPHSDPPPPPTPPPAG